MNVLSDTSCYPHGLVVDKIASELRGLREDTRAKLKAIFSEFTVTDSYDKLSFDLVQILDPSLVALILEYCRQHQITTEFLKKQFPILVRHAYLECDQVAPKKMTEEESIAHGEEDSDATVESESALEQPVPKFALKRRTLKHGSSDDTGTATRNGRGRPARAKKSRALGVRKVGNMWLKEESLELAEIVTSGDPYTWPKVAAQLNDKFHRGKTPAMCHQHYRRVADPCIKQTEWTPEEDRKLVDAYKKYKSKWSKISSVIGGRPDTQCRRRWVRLQQLESRGRTRWDKRTATTSCTLTDT